MSLDFCLRITCELKPDVPQPIIDFLQKCQDGEKLFEEDMTIFPWETGDLRFLFDSSRGMSSDAFAHFFFHKRYHNADFELNERFTNNYWFHLETVWRDDDYYVNGHWLLAWLATLSQTNGFVGTISEEGDLSKVQLLYFNQGCIEIHRYPDGEEVYKWNLQDIIDSTQRQ